MTTYVADVYGMSVALALLVKIVIASVLLSGNQCEAPILICGQVHGSSVVQGGCLVRFLGSFVVCVYNCMCFLYACKSH